MLNADLQAIIEDARKFAAQRRHEFLTLEHILFFLLRQNQVKRVLAALPTPIDSMLLYRDVRDYLMKQPSQPFSVAPQTLNAVNRVIKRALEQINDRAVCPAEILPFMLDESRSYAAYFLLQAGVKADELNAALERLRDEDKLNEELNNTAREVKGRARIHRNENSEERLSADEEALFCINLNQQAAEGKLAPLIGREAELERVIQILHRKTKNNPIIVGAAGVGKTALVEGLVHAIVNGAPQIPPSLRSSVIYSINVTSLMSGTKYRGDLEARVKRFLDRFSADPNAILFFDEIHGIISHSKSVENNTDLADMMRPAIDGGNLRIIGTTTDRDYRKIFEGKATLSRRFQRVDLAVPSGEEALRVVRGVYRNFEDFHGVSYSEEALQASVRLAQRYLTDRQLPDSAIDLLDEVGARVRLDNDDTLKRIDRTQIETLVAQQARLPYIHNDDDHSTLRQLDGELNRQVFGQAEAIRALVSALKLGHAGLRSKEKPLGSFLFTGPTGVGKTELCKQLATAMSMNLIRFDMSEYMEAHSVSKLIGTPPGYVGYEQEGLLCERILKMPYAVLLLDEIEKAHPDLMNVLLQMMDNGLITDNTGREINCRNLIIVMTSNVGATVNERQHIGFGQQDVNRSRGDYEQAVKNHFTPEFRNRLDAVINFAPLSEGLMLPIVDKFIAELREQLAEKRLSLELDEAARHWLARAGYDPKMGARPLGRVIERELKLPLAELVLFEELRDATIGVRLDGDRLQLTNLAAPELVS